MARVRAKVGIIDDELQLKQGREAIVSMETAQRLKRSGHLEIVDENDNGPEPQRRRARRATTESQSSDAQTA